MAKRKWSNLDVPGEEPSQAEPTERELKVRELTARRSDKTMKELAAEYAAVVEEEEFADRMAAMRSILYEALERRILQDLKTVEEVSGRDIWRGEGQTFSPQILVIPQVKDRAKLLQHIKDTNQEALLTLPDPRLRSIVVKMLESLVEMTPAQRAESNINLAEPLPGVTIFTKTVVHRSTF